MSDAGQNSEEWLAYVQAWASAVAQTLKQIAGSAMSCQLQTQPPTELASTDDNHLWFLCTVAGGLRGELSLRMDSTSAFRAARIFMSLPLDAAAATDMTAEHSEAVLELLRQFAGRAASALKPGWGEVQLRVEAVRGAASWASSSTCWLATGSEPQPIYIELRCSAALMNSLGAQKKEISPAQEAPANPVAPATASDSKPDQAKLALLMDVELSLTLRFGARRLLLREILELSPGAVVELDRQVQEPVDMLLDGRLVARGEVVVIEGNFGLRVTELAPSGAI